jgi:hypothetical protein
VVVGIDDTDMPGTPGTGRLARLLAAEIEAGGLGCVLGVTRHQLFDGPGVPKTSHNSAAALAVRGGDASRLARRVATFLEREHAAGADPGFALVTGVASPRAVAFAVRAKQQVVTREEAWEIAGHAGVPLQSVAGSGDGVIGALCAAVLRRGGNDGRFVGLEGIREVHGTVTVGSVVGGTRVDDVVDEETEVSLAPDVLVDTCDWVRPRLVCGRAILVVRRIEERWVNVDAYRR